MTYSKYQTAINAKLQKYFSEQAKVNDNCKLVTNEKDLILSEGSEEYNILPFFRTEIMAKMKNRKTEDLRSLSSKLALALNFFAPISFWDKEMQKTFYSKYILESDNEFINDEYNVCFNDKTDFSNCTRTDYLIQTKDSKHLLNNILGVELDRVSFAKQLQQEDKGKIKSLFYGTEYLYEGKACNVQGSNPYVQYAKISQLLKKELKFNEFLRHYSLYRTLFNTSVCWNARHITFVSRKNLELISEYQAFHDLLVERVKDDIKYICDNIKILYWEDLLNNIISHIDCNQLEKKYLDHYLEFRNKYLL